MVVESTVRASGGQRPGGRTADVTLRIHEAVRGLLLESGTDACSYKNVAKRAGVERSTLYRRYPDRWDMLIDAFIDLASTEVVPDLGHSFASDPPKSTARKCSPSRPGRSTFAHSSPPAAWTMSSSTAWSKTSAGCFARAARLAEVLLEEGQRSRPRLVRSGLVVALGRRVVVEGVIDAVIEEELHGLAGTSERRDPRESGRVDPVVQ